MLHNTDATISVNAPDALLGHAKVSCLVVVTFGEEPLSPLLGVQVEVLKRRPFGAGRSKPNHVRPLVIEEVEKLLTVLRTLEVPVRQVKGPAFEAQLAHRNCEVAGSAADFPKEMTPIQRAESILHVVVQKALGAADAVVQGLPQFRRDSGLKRRD